MRRVVGLWVAVLVVLAGLASVGGAAVVGRDVAEVGVASRARSAELEVSAAAVKLVGSVVAGSATVANVGDAGARSSTAAVAWRSSAGGGGLVELGRFKVPALRAGERHKASFRVGVPKGAAGSWDVSVCADVLGQVQARAEHKSKCRSAGVVTIPASGVKGYGPTGSEPSPPPGSGGSSSPPTGSGSASSPPETVIDSGPTGLIGQSTVTFAFHGSDADDTFQCALDGAPWVSCASPQQYTALAEGAHTFEVRAVNAAGEVDPTPASASFTVEATPPQTTITSAPSGRIPTGEASLSFTSTEAASSFKCSLDGGGYSPCSSPYVIADPAAGPHTFSVQATNQAGVKETAAPPSASWSSVEAQHDLCGTITSNTTIGPDYATRYIITCSTTITSAATLTAQPGTIIKADEGAGLTVQGTLDAVGTEGEPVTFTSINDNSVGGVTGSGSPGREDWDGIYADGGSVDIEHSVVAYGGPVGGRAMGALVAVDDAFKLDGDTGSGGAAVLAQGAEVTVEDDSFVSPTEAAVIASSPDLVLSGNKATGVTNRFAYWADSSALDFAGLSSNTADHGGLAVAGAAATSEWTGSMPLVLIGGGVEYINYFDTDGYLDVPSGVTLTLAAGTVVKSELGESQCDDEGPGCSISVEGTLNATGTLGEPVTFTSINDNSVGGVTGSGSPQSAEWAGISVEPGANFAVNRADLRYAGAAITFRQLSGAVISEDDFVYDREAIAVDGTADEDPVLEALDCVPPYLSFVTAKEDFFGKTGTPPPSIDLASVLGATLPESFGNAFDAGLSLASESYSLFGDDDTIPWSIYSCPALGIPPIPVTPVLVVGIPASPWFSDPE
jgi:hypothetical protein